MSNSVPSSNPTVNAAQNANAASSSASGTTSPSVAGSGQPAVRSYANATKTAGGLAQSQHSQPQHGKSSSVSPVNGKNSVAPAVPSVTGPPIVSGNINGSAAHGDHARKQSVTISAAGVSGYTPNGGPVGPSSRPNLTFGNINNAGGASPAIAHSTPHHAPSSSLNAPQGNPRITSPAHSPSPIPQPAASGGPPPSLQSAPIAFGSQGGDSGDQSSRGVPPGAPQPQHLRRESSQSGHGDMGSPAMNRGFSASGRPARGGFNPGFPGQANSPRLGYQQPHNGQRPGGNMGGQFGPHGSPLVHPNSPFRGSRSPAMTNAQIAQQAQFANNPQMYPQQYNPHMQQHQGMYNMQQGFDASQYYGGYPGHMYPNMPYQGGPPGSPGRGFQPHASQQPYMQGQYMPNAPGMQRTPSQSHSIERPSSTAGQPLTPSMPNAHHAPTPSQVAPSPGPTRTDFQIPNKTKSKAIVIKKPDGQALDLPSAVKASSPAPTATASTGPMVVATPPPRTASTGETQHNRSDSTSLKSAAEKKSDFQEQFRKQLEAEKAEEQRRKDLKEASEKKAAQEKEEAEAKAAKEKEEAAAKELKEKQEAEAAAAKAEEEEKAKKDAEEAARLKKEDDERIEREIQEMEELERQEEERERAYQEKKRKDDAEKKAKQAAEQDAELKRLEREAEEREAAKSSGQSNDTADAALFASLKKPTLGPGANAASESGTSTPTSTAEAPSQPQVVKPAAGKVKPRPAGLQLDTNKAVEPDQPTAGMQSLKSARFLQVRGDVINYPEGIASPNPALNKGGRGKGRQYDKDFLMQFQTVFQEKPSVDWEKKLNEVVGDTDRSSTGTRTPSTASMKAARPASGFAGPFGTGTGFGGGMGGFKGPGGPSTMPARPGNPMMQSSFGRGGFPQGAGMGGRQPSFPAGMPSPNTGGRSGSTRGPKGGRERSNRNESRRADEEAAKKMPLTAGMDLKPLEVSRSGWKPASIVGEKQPTVASNGLMAPDLVQRKVKSNLNKMTPENFEKIADQILAIAGQSVHESDGRTLRQVIQLTFEKACDEAHWASMYAKFCKRMLETMSTDIKDDNVLDKTGKPVVGGALFRKYLLNRCQEDFERGWEADLPDKPKGEESQETKMLSDEYYLAAAAKRKGLGLIQFIGELFKLSMLTPRIMHECVLRLLNFEGLPEESTVESLVKLLRTVGATLSGTENGQDMLKMYFERITKVMDMEELPSRLRFMLMDINDLRKAGWKSKDDAKGPKTITEIHQEAQAAQAAQEAERQRQNQRGGGRPPMGRGDARAASGGMPPPDYNRNQIGMDDLRKLSKNASSRAGNSGPQQFGPSSLFARTGSRRGPAALSRGGEDSGASSRTGTPPTKPAESNTNTNSFSALAALENQEEGTQDVASPPTSSAQPAAGEKS